MRMTGRGATAEPRSVLPPFLESALAELPPLAAAKRRNVLLDQFFYDVGALDPREVDWLVAERTVEGSILVVFPRGARGPVSLSKYDDHAALRAAPGALLQRFAVAGVGSSDLGAAALARNVADHYGEPVGAVIAGYGLADLAAEGLGGWFVLGAANRWRALVNDWVDAWARLARSLDPAPAAGPAATRFDGTAADRLAGPDSAALYRLLIDEDRQVVSLLGHSKGCLSIATALQRLADAGPSPALDRAAAVRVVTLGAVVETPPGLPGAVQFLGSLDAFGGLNSRRDRPFETVPGAWHHLNTALPAALSVGEALNRADRIFAAADRG
jgi:hypothetical protein